MGAQVPDNVTMCPDLLPNRKLPTLLRLGLLISFWLCLAQAGHAASPWTGVVSSVVDGDTVWVKPHPGQTQAAGDAVDIRIDGIDAPEICQNYGDTAKQTLARRLLHQSVTVMPRRTDSYGRQLARISLAGEDVGDWMVRNGHAWSYHYRRQPGPYAEQEAMARGARRGLFQLAEPEQPRDFRKRHGTCHVPVRP